MDNVMQEGEKLLCLTYTPVAYLYSDMDYATMGVAFLEYDYDRWEMYYEMHPDKQPTIIYSLDLQHTSEEEKFVEELYNDYHVEIVDNRMTAILK